MNGLAGAGAFSDGKFIISTEYGGHLQEFIGEKSALQYMQRLDSILMEFGAPTNTFTPDDSLVGLCEKNGLHIKKGIVKHFGTENNLRIMNALINWIEHRSTILTQCTVTDVNPDMHLIYVEPPIEPIYAQHIVLAVGRSGSKFFENWCNSHAGQTSP